MSARFNRPITAALAGVAALIATAAPVAAQDGNIVVRGLPEGSRMELVSYSDLNLRLIAQLNILNDRVARAVRRVCDFEPRDNLNSSYRNCADASFAVARPQIHRAYLRANRLAVR
jgi:UrcA family protein